MLKCVLLFAQNGSKDVFKAHWHPPGHDKEYPKFADCWFWPWNVAEEYEGILNYGVCGSSDKHWWKPTLADNPGAQMIRCAGILPAAPPPAIRSSTRRASRQKGIILRAVM